MRNASKYLTLTVTFILVCSFALLSRPPQKGEYHEDFSQEDGWFSEDWNPNGYIQITQSTELRVTGTHCPYDVTGPFFEIDLLFVKCEDGLAGIEIIPADTSELNYAVMINTEGYYAIFRSSIDGSTWYYSKRWTYARSLLLGTGTVNHIQIEVKPRYALVSFNGVLATTLNAEISPIGVSLAVGTFEGTTTARFDNLQIYKDTKSDME